MKDEFEKTVLRRLESLESHIVNLTINLQQINEIFQDRNALSEFLNVLSKPIVIDDRGITKNIKDIKELIAKFETDLYKIDIAQMTGEYQFIGRKLHLIETWIHKIKTEGLKKEIDLSFTVEGYKMVKEVPEYINEAPKKKKISKK